MSKKKCNFPVSPALTKKEKTSVSCHKVPGNYEGKFCFVAVMFQLYFTALRQNSI